jgi:hypothetical protein
MISHQYADPWDGILVLYEPAGGTQPARPAVHLRQAHGGTASLAKHGALNDGHYNFGMTPERPPTDMRKLRRDFNSHGLLLVVLALIIIGGAFVTIMYGPSGAVASLLCLVAGAGLTAFMWLILTLIGKLVGED